MFRLSRSFGTSSRRLFRHKGTFKTNDATVESDEILSDNNPWSPTLLTDRVYVKNGIKSEALPENFRLSYEPLYEAPGTKYIAMLKRLTISFAVIGVYGAKLLYELVQFEDAYALGLIFATWTPAAIVQFKTKDYVTRIFRLYDKNMPQTLENLVKNEKLIIEKLSRTGGKTFNSMLSVPRNESLQLSKLKQSLFLPYSSWEDYSTGKKREFYILDNVGGMKMDRLWGIVENNSGVNSGRFIE